MPWGTIQSTYALVYAVYPAPPTTPSRTASVPAVVESRVTTQYASWLETTSSTAQPADLSGRPRPLPRQSNRGRQWNPAERSEGTSARAWTTMPAVVP